MSSTKSDLHIAALSYVIDGWKVFPCSPGTKRPLAGSKGFLDASDDPRQIDAWWSEHPEANIGAVPDSLGLCVIDLDTTKPEYDPAIVAALGLPPTYTVETPSGGQHLYFKGSLRGSESRLAPKVDTRGRGSYVLLPPSRTEAGAYRSLGRQAVAVLPPHIREMLPDRVKREAEHDQDHPANIARARLYLKKLELRECGFPTDCYDDNGLIYEAAAALVGDLGLTAETAAEVMAEEWAAALPFPGLQKIVENAALYCQNSGAHAQLASERFANATDEKKAFFSPEPPPAGAFRIYDGPDLASVPEPSWIIPDILPQGAVGLISAAKGSFKTFLALDLALAVATGLPSFAGAPVARGAVYYGAHEGLPSVARQHVPAWCLARGLDPAGRHGFLLLDGPRAGETDAAWIEAILAHAETTKAPPLLLVLDTYSRCMAGLDENDPRDVNKFLTFAEALLKIWPGCSVLLPAHKGKDAARGTRGSSAFEAGVDFVLDLDRPDKGLVAEMSVRFMRGAREREKPWRVIGRPMHGSLVFSLDTEGVDRPARRILDPFGPEMVADVLRQLGATASGAPITTEVLAETLTPHEDGESGELRRAKLAASAQELRRLATKKLRPLSIGSGASLRWFVPAA